MKSIDIHIGENILPAMTQKGIAKAELAGMPDLKPQSGDYLLKRKSIDADTSKMFFLLFFAVVLI